MRSDDTYFQLLNVLEMAKSGGQGRNRTTDTRIFSPLLYQLSYLAIVWLIYPTENEFSVFAYPVAVRTCHIARADRPPGRAHTESGVLDRRPPAESRSSRTLDCAGPLWRLSCCFV